ncbi:MAG: substrate-binding domain-containing protein [Lachnospiraceae bacterium]
MRKIFTRSIACCLLVLFLCGCTVSEKASPKEITIAISVISETHNWPMGVLYYAEQEIERVANENNWNFEFKVAADTNEQSNQIIDLVNQGVDCIIMLPMDGASLKTAAMSVQAAEIPLVIFDREIPDFSPTATVKGDNTSIGTLTADIFNGYFPDGTKVLEFMGDTSTVPQQRTDGFDEKLNANFVKEQVGYTGWQREDSKILFQQWIASHSQTEISEVGAIFTHDDEIALGVLDALDELEEQPQEGKNFDKLKVIAGSAGDKELYTRIMEEEKYYIFSLTYRPEMIAEAIKIGEKIIKGEEYDEMTIIPTLEVNRKNVELYYDENSPY